MSDQYENVRNLSFEVVAPALDIDLKRFKRKKTEWVGPCPIHGSKNNTACFRYADDGRYHCFSCEAKGKGAIDLTMALRNIGFAAAVELLKAFEGNTPAKEKNPLSKGDGQATEPSGELKPYTGKYEKYKVECEWLNKRVPDAEIRKKFGVFCYDNPARKSAYSGRVMIPFKDMQGNLFGYLGRAVPTTNDETPDIPKYLIPANFPKSRFLFGSDILQAGTFGQAPLRRVYLVESPFCVMKFASLGLPALSPYGWSVSPAQLECLATITRGIVYLPDRNKADQIAQVALDLSKRIWVRCPELPAGVDDPEQLSRQQVLDLLSPNIA